MAESFAPSAHCFPTVKHEKSVKAASSTNYSGGSRNKDSVAIVFVMVTVMYVSMTSRASSVIGRCPSLVVGVRLLSRSLNGGRKRR